MLYDPSIFNLNLHFMNWGVREVFMCGLLGKNINKEKR